MHSANLNVSKLTPWEEIDATNTTAIGVLATCGSYNPIHNAHIEMFEGAKHRLADVHPDVKVVGGYLSPVNDAYGKVGLLDFQTRAAMCNAALADNAWISVDCWEGMQSEYQRSYIVLSHLVKEAREYYSSTATTDIQRALAADLRMYFVCGGDLFESFYKPRCWKLHLLEKIFTDFHLCVIARVGSEDPIEVMKTRTEPLASPDEPGVKVDLTKFTDKVTVCRIPPNESSSTLVRKLLKDGSDEAKAHLAHLVPTQCVALMIEKKYYH